LAVFAFVVQFGKFNKGKGAVRSRVCVQRAESEKRQFLLNALELEISRESRGKSTYWIATWSAEKKHTYIIIFGFNLARVLLQRQRKHYFIGAKVQNSPPSVSLSLLRCSETRNIAARAKFNRIHYAREPK
jgi:hypothetical protein